MRYLGKNPAIEMEFFFNLAGGELFIIITDYSLFAILHKFSQPLYIFKKKNVLKIRVADRFQWYQIAFVLSAQLSIVHCFPCFSSYLLCELKCFISCRFLRRY